MKSLLLGKLKLLVVINNAPTHVVTDSGNNNELIVVDLHMVSLTFSSTVLKSYIVVFH